MSTALKSLKARLTLSPSLPLSHTHTKALHFSSTRLISTMKNHQDRLTLWLQKQHFFLSPPNEMWRGAPLIVVDAQMSHDVPLKSCLWIWYESTACLWSSALKPETWELSQVSQGNASSLWEVGREGWGGTAVCLTYLHAADFHCLPTLLTITKGLCTLAAAQHSYTYCGPLSKETCTTSSGIPPKRPQPQFVLQDQHCSPIWALPPDLCPHGLRPPPPHSVFLLLPLS